MQAELIVAIIGAVVAIMTALITNFLSQRSQLKFEERKLKEEYYENYIKAASDNVLMKGSNTAFDDAQNRLILVASPKVVQLLMNFHDKVKPSAPPLSGAEHDKLLTELIKAMRYDLFGTDKVNIGYPTIHLSGLRPYDKD